MRTNVDVLQPRVGYQKFDELAWLWSGKGIIEAQTPKISDGWISQ